MDFKKSLFFLLGITLIPLRVLAFSDVTEDYLYAPAIHYFEEQKIIKGFPDGTFRPEAPLRRSDFLQILAKTLNRPELLPEKPSDQWLTVSDTASIISFIKLGENRRIFDPWYLGFIQDLEAWHLLLPTFVHPDDFLNRGEGAELVYRLKFPEKTTLYTAYDTTLERFVLQGEAPITRIPWKLSIPIFARMRLEGTDFEMGKPIGSDKYAVHYPFSYRSNGVRVTGEVWVPKAKAPFEGIILAHGYFPIEKYHTGSDISREADFVVRAGKVVFIPDYRGHGNSERDPENRGLYDGAIGYSMDVVNLVKALEKANLPFLKKEPLDFFGHSMGGAIGLNIAVSFPELFPRMTLYAPSGGDAWRNYERWWQYRKPTKDSRRQWGLPSQNQGYWKGLSSNKFIDQIESRLLIFHGEEDGKDPDKSGVPLFWTQDLVERLRIAGKSFEYIQVPRQGHVFVGKPWVEMMRKVY